MWERCKTVLTAKDRGTSTSPYHMASSPMPPTTELSKMPSIALFPRSNLRNRLAAAIALAGSGYRLVTPSTSEAANTNTRAQSLLLVVVVAPLCTGGILVYGPDNTSSQKYNELLFSLCKNVKKKHNSNVVTASVVGKSC